MNKYHKVPLPLSAVLGAIFLIGLLALTSETIPVGHWLQQIHSPAHTNLAAREEGLPLAPVARN